jgi:hypothetical protein
MPDKNVSSYGEINSAGAPFPGSSGNNAFTDKSTPAMFTWEDMQTISRPVTEIIESSGKISFKFMGGSGTANPYQPAGNSTFNVYPNPVDENFHINGIDAQTTVTVTDLSGRIVLTQTVSSDEPVAAGHLQPGNYVARAAGKTVKVIKR